MCLVQQKRYDCLKRQNSLNILPDFFLNEKQTGVSLVMLTGYRCKILVSLTTLL